MYLEDEKVTMLLNLTKKIDKLCKYSENIVKYNQLGSYNMLALKKRGQSGADHHPCGGTGRTGVRDLVPCLDHKTHQADV